MNTYLKNKDTNNELIFNSIRFYQLLYSNHPELFESFPKCDLSVNYPKFNLDPDSKLDHACPKSLTIQKPENDLVGVSLEELVRSRYFSIDQLSFRTETKDRELSVIKNVMRVGPIESYVDLAPNFSFKLKKLEKVCGSLTWEKYDFGEAFCFDCYLEHETYAKSRMFLIERMLPPPEEINEGNLGFVAKRLIHFNNYIPFSTPDPILSPWNDEATLRLEFLCKGLSEFINSNLTALGFLEIFELLDPEKYPPNDKDNYIRARFRLLSHVDLERLSTASLFPKVFNWMDQHVHHDAFRCFSINSHTFEGIPNYFFKSSIPHDSFLYSRLE